MPFKSKIERADEEHALSAHEARVIHQARVRLDAGQGISGDELGTWLDTYDLTDEIVPVWKTRGDRFTRR